LTKVIEGAPGELQLVRQRADLYVRVGAWKEAANDFQAILQTDPTDVGDWFRVALLFASAGDEQAFRRHCQAMLDRFRSGQDVRAQSMTAKACLLIPDASAITELPLAPLKAALEQRSNPESRQAWDRATLALASYRNGAATEALEYVAELARLPIYGQNSRLRVLGLSVKALAQAALNRPDAAKQTLAQAEEIVQEGLSKMRDGTETAWHDVLVAHILCQEAAKTIQALDQD
jgi:tetratricopeptide (TPR) repeat protein